MSQSAGADTYYGDMRDLYSPLSRETDDEQEESARKNRKVLVGYNGWLERTGNPSPDKKPSPPKKGILDTIWKVAKEVVSSLFRGREKKREREREQG